MAQPGLRVVAAGGLGHQPDQLDLVGDVVICRLGEPGRRCRWPRGAAPRRWRRPGGLPRSTASPRGSGAGPAGQVEVEGDLGAGVVGFVPADDLPVAVHRDDAVVHPSSVGLGALAGQLRLSPPTSAPSSASRCLWRREGLQRSRPLSMHSVRLASGRVPEPRPRSARRPPTRHRASAGLEDPWRLFHATGRPTWPVWRQDRGQRQGSPLDQSLPAGGLQELGHIGWLTGRDYGTALRSVGPPPPRPPGPPRPRPPGSGRPRRCRPR